MPDPATRERGASAVAVPLGIDMGGSSTRARLETATLDGAGVLDGVAGPGNVHTLNEHQLRTVVGAATRGLPTPTHVVLCAAGAATDETRARVSDAVLPLFPDAVLQVRPDFDAALALIEGAADVAVVVGTGSVVVSAAPQGAFITGGAGWIMGDPGSASDLGQALLRRYFEAPLEMPGEVTDRIVDALGLDRSDQILRSVHLAGAPAAELAKVAPILTALASDGVGWAIESVRSSTASLARGVAYHLRRRGLDRATLALLGGVWASSTFFDGFAADMAAHAPGAVVHDLHDRQPVDGALRLARDLASAGSER